MSRVVAWSSVGLVVALLLLGCSRRGPAPGDPEVEDVPGFKEPANAAKAGREERRTLARDNSSFALDLHRRLPREGNLVTSPFAVSTVLAMALAGARGETAGEIQKALHFSLAGDKLHPAFARLLWELHGEGKMQGYSLRLANALWPDGRLELERGFLDTLENNYSSGGQRVDFRQREQACRTINDWAKKQTDGRIKQVIEPEELHENTKLVLASAVSFRGQWQHRFSAARTKEGPFHVITDRTVEVPLMEQEAELNYYSSVRQEGDAAPYRLVVLPFRGWSMQLVVLLPARKDGLGELEKTLTAKKLDDWIRQALPHKVALTLPRFEMRTRLSLIEPLKALGIKQAFQRGKADFSGITPAASDLGLHVNRVMQQALIVVNEEGAEAAAVAQTGMKDKGKGEPLGPVEFRADRPFLFLIRHRDSGTILFLGRVVNPAA
jgi:serpin B